jgi:YVTN family beta-propeller protein
MLHYSAAHALLVAAAASTAVLAHGGSVYYLKPLTHFLLPGGDGEGVEGLVEILQWDKVNKQVITANPYAEAVSFIPLGEDLTFGEPEDLDMSGNGVPQSISFCVDEEGKAHLAVGLDVDGLTGAVAFVDVATRTIPAVVDLPTSIDAVAFSPDCSMVAAAGEGEPNDDEGVDPEGNVVIIDATTYDAKVADFREWDSEAATAKAKKDGIHLAGVPGTLFSEDVEPEYVAFSEDGSKVYVTLQEANAIAVVDVSTATVTDIFPIGFKDYSTGKLEADFSNEDGGENIQSWKGVPLKTMPQPDTIATYMSPVDGEEYMVFANEGDAKDYEMFSEEIRAGDLADEVSTLADSGLVPVCDNIDASLLDEAVLGRLKITSTEGLSQKGDCYEELVGYGGRSFSIMDTKGKVVYDSMDIMEAALASGFPGQHNSEGHLDDMDDRSDDKGIEPEGLKLVKVGDKVLAIVAGERPSVIYIFDITDPADVVYHSVNGLYDCETGDSLLGDPEGMDVISDFSSSVKGDILLVGGAYSNTLTLFEIVEGDEAPVLETGFCYEG